MVEVVLVADELIIFEFCGFKAFLDSSVLGLLGGKVEFLLRNLRTELDDVAVRLLFLRFEIGNTALERGVG